MSAVHDEMFDAGLRALRQERGTIEQARALEERLTERLGEAALAATVTRASTRLSRLWTLLGVGALLGLGVLLDHERDAQATAPIERAAVEDVAVARAAPHAPPLPVTVVPAAQPEPSPRAVAAPRRARRATPKPAVAPASMTSPHPRSQHMPEDELTLLERSRAALDADAKGALALAEQHAHAYPSGRFAQEREVLAIQALLKQARDAEAIVRAQRLIDEHEGSPYALRLREMLIEKPRPVHR